MVSHPSQKFNKININKPFLVLFVVSTFSIIIASSLTWQWSQNIAKAKEKQVTQKISELESVIAKINESSALDKTQLSYNIDQLQEQLELLATESAVLERDKLKDKIDLVKEVADKFQSYQSKGAKVATASSQLNEIYLSLVNNKDDLSNQINGLDEDLDSIWQEKLKADAAKAAQALSAPVSNSPGSGYSRITVQTDRGSFVTDIIKASLSNTKVVTVTGNDGNCDNNCVAKPLAQYISENSGFAGINGSYFCPPDYPSCSTRIYSYDFPVYSSIHNKWINADKLFWNDRGMAAFQGSNPRFCASANSCDSGGVSAGIINYPTLVSGGNVSVNEGGLPDTLTQNKGLRGSIGVGGDQVFLAIIRGATVTDAAHVMKSIGAQHALNLDGGGSSALYYNGYKVGPGRLLPNAIVLKN